MKYITWNDAVDITSIPFCYICEICRQQIGEKNIKAIRIEWPDGKSSNHYFHDRHVAISYADWLHKINEQIKQMENGLCLKNPTDSEVK